MKTIPYSVRRAQLAGDTKSLQALGRQGGLKAAANRRKKELQEEARKEKLAEEMQTRAVEANEDICPID